ncbi:solute symporter family protein [Nevskia soli]|uniref:solute symporter family protein n=1 Tax=Nevskia soli TaxID=418856 RepID=UPI000B0AC20E|nr:cation acetate symporter [Nevskia soli]
MVALALFIALSALLTWWAARRSRGVSGFFVSGRTLSPLQNGLALSGDFMSAASFLGVTGLISIFGFDGLIYQVGFVSGWILILLVVAEPIRNCGKYTLSDVVALRLPGKNVRIATSSSSLLISLAYLLAQLVGAGALASLLVPSLSASAAILLVGILMIGYVVFGGMTAATYVQIVKAVLIWCAATLLLFFALRHFSFSLNLLLGQARQTARHPETYLAPGAYFSNRFDTLSLALALALGTAGLPHVMMRFYTVPTAAAARNSAKVALMVITTFAVTSSLLGFCAAAMVGYSTILKANPAGNSAVVLLSAAVGGGQGTLGGEIVLACVSAIAFATILAVVSGIMISSASVIAHDILASVVFAHKGKTTDQVKLARIATILFGAIAIALALLVQSLNVAFLVGLAFAVSASSNLPVILYTLFWERFNNTGAIATVVTGVASSIILVALGPAVIGPKGLLLHNLQPLVQLANPGIISIPCGFLAGWVGTLLGGSHKIDSTAFQSHKLRMLSGHGAEAAVQEH